MREKSKARVFTAFYWTPMTLFAGAPDPEDRARYNLERLGKRFPDMEFVNGGLFNFDAMEKVYGACEDGGVDAVLMVGIDILPSGSRWFNADESALAPLRKKPVIWTNDMPNTYPMGYAGMDILNTAMRENLPMVSVQSTRFEDLARPLNLVRALHNMKESKVLLVGCLDNPEMVKMLSQEMDGWWRQDPDPVLAHLEDFYGTEVVIMTIKEFKEKYYDAIGEKEGDAVADEVTRGASRVVGPTREEIVKHAKWIPAARNAMNDMGADGLMALEFTTEMAGLGKPCMAMCELKDEGYAMAAMGCIDSLVTQLLMGYMTGKPGFTNDTMIDTSRNAAIHAYCCGPRRYRGRDDQPLPYEVTHCCAGGCTFAIDPHELQGETFTSVRVCLNGDLVLTHTGRLAGRIHREISPEEWGDWESGVMGKWQVPVDFQEEHFGCQNRYLIETNAERVWENFIRYWNHSGFHRTLYLGDYRKDVQNMATLAGLKLVEEDRDHV